MYLGLGAREGREEGEDFLRGLRLRDALTEATFFVGSVRREEVVVLWDDVALATHMVMSVLVKAF